MIELSILEKYKLRRKAKKIYNKSCLYLWISEKEYTYPYWERFILEWGNQLFYDILINWIDGKELTDFEIESKYKHNKIIFNEIYNYWRNDFITALWLVVHFYNDHFNNETIRNTPNGIASILWRAKIY